MICGTIKTFGETRRCRRFVLILFADVADTEGFVGRLNFSPANDHSKRYCAKATSKKSELSRVGGRGRFRGRDRRAPPGADEATARPEQRSKSRDASAEPAISGTAIGQEVGEGACGFMKAASKPLNRSLPRPSLPCKGKEERHLFSVKHFFSREKRVQ